METSEVSCSKVPLIQSIIQMHSKKMDSMGGPGDELSDGAMKMMMGLFWGGNWNMCLFCIFYMNGSSFLNAVAIVFSEPFY